VLEKFVPKFYGLGSRSGQIQFEKSGLDLHTDKNCPDPQHCCKLTALDEPVIKYCVISRWFQKAIIFEPYFIYKEIVKKLFVNVKLSFAVV
jgi:hypothetical protein